MQLYKVKRKVLSGEPDVTNSYICVASNMNQAFDLRDGLFSFGDVKLGDVSFEVLATVVNGPARLISSSCSACQPLPQELV